MENQQIKTHRALYHILILSIVTFLTSCQSKQTPKYQDDNNYIFVEINDHTNTISHSDKLLILNIFKHEIESSHKLTVTSKIDLLTQAHINPNHPRLSTFIEAGCRENSLYVSYGLEGKNLDSEISLEFEDISTENLLFSATKFARYVAKNFKQTAVSKNESRCENRSKERAENLLESIDRISLSFYDQRSNEKELIPRNHFDKIKNEIAPALTKKLYLKEGHPKDSSKKECSINIFISDSYTFAEKYQIQFSIEKGNETLLLYSLDRIDSPEEAFSDHISFLCRSTELLFLPKSKEMTITSAKVPKASGDLYVSFILDSSASSTVLRRQIFNNIKSILSISHDLEIYSNSDLITKPCQLTACRNIYISTPEPDSFEIFLKSNSFASAEIAFALFPNKFQTAKPQSFISLFSQQVSSSLNLVYDNEKLFDLEQIDPLDIFKRTEEYQQEVAQRVAALSIHNRGKVQFSGLKNGFFTFDIIWLSSEEAHSFNKIFINEESEQIIHGTKPVYEDYWHLKKEVYDKILSDETLK